MYYIPIYCNMTFKIHKNWFHVEMWQNIFQISTLWKRRKKKRVCLMSEAFKKQVMHDGKSNFRNGQFVPNGSSLSHLQTNVGSLLFWHKNRTTYMCLLISNIRKKRHKTRKGSPEEILKKKGWWRSSLEDEFHQKKNGLLLKKLFRASKLHTIIWKFDGKIPWNQLILC